MNKFCFQFIVCFALIFQATGSHAGQLSSSLEQYKAKTQAALTLENGDAARQYLQSCLLAVEYLKGIEAGDPGMSVAFSKLVEIRTTADINLGTASGAQGVRVEVAAYNKHLEPYRGEEYIGLVALQDQLLERKYFKTETAKNSNYIEGLINSRWSLTSTDRGNPKEVFATAHLGVSPWEAIFRLEPAIVVEGGTQAAILGTAGLSYTFFPETTTNGRTTFDETFWSEWVKKTGGRIGIGATEKDSKPYLIIGAGVQIRAVGLWGFYEPGNMTYMLGISVVDLSILKKVIPWFD